MDAPIVVLERDPGYLEEVWAWYGIGVLIMALRFAVRIRMVGFKGFEGDDYVTFLVLACYTMDAVFVTECYWLGTNVDIDPRIVSQLTDHQISRLRRGSMFEIGAWYSYTFLIWCMKATMLFFYNRITFGLNQHRIVRWLAWFCAVCYIAVFLTITFGCSPTKMNWQVRPLPPRRCTLKEQNFLVTAALNVLTDAAILAVPVPLLWKLRVPIHKKVVIALLLSSGLFVISAAIIRATATLSAEPSSITINRWGVRETIVGILSINIPILRPLFSRRFWTAGPVVPRTQQSSYGFGNGHKKGSSGSYALGPSFELKSDKSGGGGGGFNASVSLRQPSPTKLRTVPSDDSAVVVGNADFNNSQEHIMRSDMARDLERGDGVRITERHDDEDDEDAEQELRAISEYAHSDDGGGRHTPAHHTHNPSHSNNDTVVFIQHSYAVSTSRVDDPSSSPSSPSLSDYNYNNSNNQNSDAGTNTNRRAFAHWAPGHRGNHSRVSSPGVSAPANAALRK